MATASSKRTEPTLLRVASATRQLSRLDSATPGVISIAEIYTLDEAKRRLRWSDSAIRAARRKGLKLLACGKRRYVSGQEIARFLEEIQV